MMRAFVALSVAALAITSPALAHDDEEPHDHGAPALPPPAAGSGYAAPNEGYSDPGVVEPASEEPSEATDATESDTAPRAVAAPSDKQGVAVVRRRTIDDHDWRTRARDESDDPHDLTDFTHFYFELRFGPYSPEVDEEFEGCSGDGCPYARYFGDDALFYFGLEVDWLPLYIPYVVSIGPAFGWGVTSASGKARTASGDEAGSDTGLTIFPMHISGVARFDGPLREMRLPLVPYVKAGLGIGLWSASGPNADKGTQSAEGSSMGLHLAIGGAISLNAFDPTAAMAMKENTGISYANIWAEWMWANLDGIGSTPAMHVGTSTVVLGLALDF